MKLNACGFTNQEDAIMKDVENVGWLGGESVTSITVEAVSKRGKQIIKQHGDRWWLCRIEERLACFGMEAGGVLIAPAGAHWHSAESRWVRATDWLKWDDQHLRPTAASILELADMPSFVPAGS